MKPKLRVLDVLPEVSDILMEIAVEVLRDEFGPAPRDRVKMRREWDAQMAQAMQDGDSLLRLTASMAEAGFRQEEIDAAIAGYGQRRLAEDN